jgi:hypothetical protein
MRELHQIQMEAVILKRGSYARAPIFKSFGLSAKGMSLAKAFYLNKGNVTFNGV